MAKSSRRRSPDGGRGPLARGGALRRGKPRPTGGMECPEGEANRLSGKEHVQNDFPKRHATNPERGGGKRTPDPKTHSNKNITERKRNSLHVQANRPGDVKWEKDDPTPTGKPGEHVWDPQRKEHGPSIVHADKRTSEREGDRHFSPPSARGGRSQEPPPRKRLENKREKQTQLKRPVGTGERWARSLPSEPRAAQSGGERRRAARYPTRAAGSEIQTPAFQREENWRNVRRIRAQSSTVTSTGSVGTPFGECSVFRGALPGLSNPITLHVLEDGDEEPRGQADTWGCEWAASANSSVPCVCVLTLTLSSEERRRDRGQSGSDGRP